ncbi:hypothetical protein, partial [Mesorhizobium sp. M1295]|uniref:hypothetical protein n=1 Tax=Mesorhizobium sp. M1295 TaxID=2957076 RepID=UPI003337AC1E
HHRAMAARPSEQAPFSLQNFLQNLQDTISNFAATQLRSMSIHSNRRRQVAKPAPTVKVQFARLMTLAGTLRFTEMTRTSGDGFCAKDARVGAEKGIADGCG